MCVLILNYCPFSKTCGRVLCFNLLLCRFWNSETCVSVSHRLRIYLWWWVAQRDAACDGAVCDGHNYHKCFQCILLYYLKLYSYVYNDILKGTTHVFFPRMGGPDPPALPISAHEPVQLPSYVKMCNVNTLIKTRHSFLGIQYTRGRTLFALHDLVTIM